MDHNAICLFAHPMKSVASSEETLIGCAREYARGCAIDGGSFAVSRTALGKPFFPGLPDIHCSITHSGDWWLSAFARQNVGIDLQIHQRADTKAIARRFFHPMEIAYLEEKPPYAFFAVWATKESYIKYTGRGLSQDLKSFSVIADGEMVTTLEETSFRHFHAIEGYAFSICAPSVDEVLLACSKVTNITNFV